MAHGSVDYVVLERILARTEDPRDLPLETLKSITNDFSVDREIGSGGFGKVFKGVLPNGSTVAVKKILVTKDTIDDKSFDREVKSQLRGIDHENVVRFLGFCSNTHCEVITRGSEEILLPQIRERLLCFEYISNGNLNKHITDELRGLEWNIRYQIIKGICNGLQYLHERKIVHMDLKPANIMIDNDMIPKITDFGLARPDGNSVTTGHRFVSCFYSAPEYVNGGTTTIQCDIYSLGVTIIEVVTGRKEILDKNKVLRRWRLRCKSSGNTRLLGHQVTKCIEIAESCMEIEPTKRPSLANIIVDLDKIANTNSHISAVGQINPTWWDDDDMLGVRPLELRFPFELNKEISNEVVLTNDTDSCIAFNIKTDSKLHDVFCTQPNKRIVPRKSNCTVTITMKAMTEGRSMPDDDKFIVQSSKVEDDLTDKDITLDMFKNETGKVVDEVNLTVVYDEESDKAQADQSLEHNAPVNEEPNMLKQHSKRKRLNFSLQPEIIPTTGTDMNAPTAIKAGTVTALTGAMGSLRNKLLELLNEDHNLEISVRNNIKYLERQLTSTHADLYKLSQAQRDQLEPMDKEWAKDMRGLSYNIEDIIDDLMVRIDRSESFTSSQDFLKGIADIIDQVREVSMWHDKYKVPDFVSIPAISNTVDNTDLSARFEDPRKLIGIEGPRDELVKRLTGWGDEVSSMQHLKVISICGEGGLGKTTLAKSVFDSLSERFLLKAFVTVGRNPDSKRLIKDIIYELDNTYSKCSDTLNKNRVYHTLKYLNLEQLVDKLKDVLRYKRYLIVVDDMWDIKTWNKIKYAFVDDRNGSRVITTSRIFNVSEHSGEVCKLEPLSYDDSKKLFYTTLSTSKGTWIFGKPDEESTQYILEKCDGLPLAIITLASLLCHTKPEEWPEMYSRIGFGLNGTRDDNAKQALLFSYNHLPCHLKTCLLYLSIFPEDRVIEKNMLVWKWIAEGFVHEEQGETLFKVGERYFYELINRSIIQPVQHPAYLTIWGCLIHDMVRDLICSIAKEDEFVTILDRDGRHVGNKKNDARIVAVQNRVLEQRDLGNTSKHNVRSFNATMSNLSGSELDSLLPGYKVLRVLSLKDSIIYGAGDTDARELPYEPSDRLNVSTFHYECCSGGQPTEVINIHEGLQGSRLQNITGLHHLRYLGLSGTDISNLPEELGDSFRSLLILDLRDTEIDELPKSVTLLRKLKCLLCGIIVKLPVGMGSLTSLEELQLHLVLDDIKYSLDQYIAIGNFVHEVGKLKELRVLRIRLKILLSPILTKALLQSLNNLTKLEELEIYDPTGGWNHPNIWCDYSPRKRLRHVRLCNSEPPTWMINSTLRNVTYLHLEVSSLTVGYINNLECLEELRSLFLFIPFHVGINFHDVIEAAFPKLRYFKTNCWLKYQQGAMRCLECLELVVQVRTNVSFDFDSLRYLLLLQKVTAVIENMGAKREKSDAVKAAVRHAIDNHPNSPILDLHETNWCTDDKNKPGSHHDDGREIEKDSDGEQTDDELLFWGGCCDGIYRK